MKSKIRFTFGDRLIYLKAARTKALSIHARLGEQGLLFRNKIHLATFDLSRAALTEPLWVPILAAFYVGVRQSCTGMAGFSVALTVIL